MKNLIATTALALTLAAPLSTAVFADAHTMGAVTTETKGDFYAQDFIGKEVYTSDITWDENYFAKDGWEKEWNNIGEVENLILTQDGKVRAVMMDIGGFLGMGERRVAIPMDQISFIRNDGEWDNYFIAVKAKKADLEKMPVFTAATADERKKMYDPKM